MKAFTERNPRPLASWPCDVDLLSFLTQNNIEARVTESRPFVVGLNYDDPLFMIHRAERQTLYLRSSPCRGTGKEQTNVTTTQTYSLKSTCIISTCVGCTCWLSSSVSISFINFSAVFSLPWWPKEMLVIVGAVFLSITQPVVLRHQQMCDTFLHKKPDATAIDYRHSKRYHQIFYVDPSKTVHSPSLVLNYSYCMISTRHCPIKRWILDIVWKIYFPIRSVFHWNY